MNSKRLLAAIMFTDMVGYTALMQENEARAKSNRDRHRKILEKCISGQEGEILQYYGDGTLSIFKSAIEAVQCAVQIQVELQKNPKIPLRIGIHTGDIVHDNEGVYGDCVNVASRLERLAVAGSILISDKVFDEIKNHKTFTTCCLGKFELKNVKKPVEVYAINNRGIKVPSSEEISLKHTSENKSIAVLPFVNMSSDIENEYFSDGITEELLNALAKVPGLQVTSRTSSFAFKGKNIDVKQIGLQLGAKSILEGSVRKAGNRVRITAQLINASDGYHVWSDTYDRQLDDIFEVQDEIAHKISNTLREKLSPRDKKHSLIKAPTNNIEAYNLYLKGLYHANKWTVKDAKIAEREYKKALELEPEFSLPYSGLASIYVYYGASGKRTLQEVMPTAKEYINKALELNPEATESLVVLSFIHFYFDWDWEKVDKITDKLIQANTNSADVYIIKSMLYHVKRDYKKAIPLAEKAVILDPLFSPSRFGYSAILAFAGEYKKSLEQLNKLFEINPNFPDGMCFKGMILQEKGKLEEAEKIYRSTLNIPGNEAQAIALLGALAVEKNDRKLAIECIEDLHKMEVTTISQQVFYQIAYLSAAMKDIETMYKYLNKSLQLHESSLIHLYSTPVFEPYRDESRFQEIMKKIGLV